MKHFIIQENIFPMIKDTIEHKIDFVEFIWQLIRPHFILKGKENSLNKQNNQKVEEENQEENEEENKQSEK